MQAVLGRRLTRLVPQFDPGHRPRNEAEQRPPAERIEWTVREGRGAEHDDRLVGEALAPSVERRGETDGVAERERPVAVAERIRDAWPEKLRSD
jgi:hypothetical protein